MKSIAAPGVLSSDAPRRTRTRSRNAKIGGAPAAVNPPSNLGFLTRLGRGRSLGWPTIFRPEVVVPTGLNPNAASLVLALYGPARIIPLALFTFAAIYKQATSALLILGTLAGGVQLLDAEIGLFDHDPDEPTVQLRAPFAERMVQTLVRAGPEAVDGHSKARYAHLAHGSPCLIVNCNQLSLARLVLYRN